MKRGETGGLEVGEEQNERMNEQGEKKNRRRCTLCQLVQE